jgi:hypothetical protein
MGGRCLSILWSGLQNIPIYYLITQSFSTFNDIVLIEIRLNVAQDLGSLIGSYLPHV